MKNIQIEVQDLVTTSGEILSNNQESCPIAMNAAATPCAAYHEEE